MTEQPGRSQLEEQEDSLRNLGDSIDQTRAVLPEWDRTASQVLQTTRLLLCLMGAIFALPGSYLAASRMQMRRRRAAFRGGAPLSLLVPHAPRGNPFLDALRPGKKRCSGRPPLFAFLRRRASSPVRFRTRSVGTRE